MNEPGKYPYRNGMTLRDLVLMARGFRDGAYLDTAEVSRLPDDRSGGQLAVRLRVPIDSTYLLEPGSTTYPMLPGAAIPPNGAPEVPLQPPQRLSFLLRCKRARTAVLACRPPRR